MTSPQVKTYYSKEVFDRNLATSINRWSKVGTNLPRKEKLRMTPIEIDTI